MKNNTKKAAACFTITGEVTDIYSGKKQNDYVTVKVTRGEYYDLIRIVVDKAAGVEVGDNVTFTGRIETFWDKQKKVTVYNLYAENVKEA